MVDGIYTATAASPRHPVTNQRIRRTGLVTCLSSPRVGKKDGKGWVAANIPDGPRRSNRVKSISLLVFDIDNKDVVITEEELKRTVRKHGLRAIIHSTYSHTPDSPRFRLILDVSEPIEPKTHKRIALAVADELGITDAIDKVCLDAARFFYRPRCPEEQLSSYVFVDIDGDPINVSTYREKPASNVVDLQPDAESQDLNADLSCVKVDSAASAIPGVSELTANLTGKTGETPEQISKLKEALSVISSDVGRGNGSIDLDADSPDDYWLGVVWAIRGLGWDRGQDIAREWSIQSGKYTEDGFEKDWAAYDTSHSKPIGIRSVYKLAEKLRPEVKTKEATTEGAKEQKEVKTKEVKTKKAKEQKEAKSKESTLFPSPLSLLEKYSVSGSSGQMRQRMLDDVYVLRDIAILGQSTVIYAAPNVGKTLLVLWLLREQIKAGLISQNKIFYINADDNFKGGVEKTELAEEWGMQVLIPGENEFRVAEITTLMDRLAATGEASGVVLVLDTLKKFTDLMSKQTSSTFGNKARHLVSAGGTLICLAHTNKHKDADGKSIYSGTSDIVDDSDCAYVIDRISIEGNDSAKVHTVEFKNIKMRGDVATTVGFSYVRMTGQAYRELLDSVKRIEPIQVDTLRRSAERNKRFDEDREVIESICRCIRGGTTTKSAIVKAVVDETAVGNTRVRNVLERWTGNSYEEGHRWTFSRESHNAHQYSILSDPTL